MVRLALLYGFLVLLAGVLVTIGLITQNGIWLVPGFILFAFCAIFGMQPSFMSGRPRDER